MKLSLSGQPSDRRQGSKSQIKKHKNKTLRHWSAEGLHRKWKHRETNDITGAFTGMKNCLIWSAGFCFKPFRQLTKLFSRASKRAPVLCFPRFSSVVTALYRQLNHGTKYLHMQFYRYRVKFCVNSRYPFSDRYISIRLIQCNWNQRVVNKSLLLDILRYYLVMHFKI